MAKCYFGEGEEAMERLVEEFKEALREEGITTPGMESAFCSSVKKCGYHLGDHVILHPSL